MNTLIVRKFFEKHEPWLVAIPPAVWIAASMAMALTLGPSVSVLGVVVLMALPALPQLYRAHCDDKVNFSEGLVSAWTGLLLLYGFWLCWAVWLDVPPLVSRMVGYTLVGVTVLLFVLVVRVTQKIMGPGNDRKDLHNSIRANPLLVMSFFLGLFLLVTYYLALALAFQERAEGEGLGHHLYSSKLPIIEPSTQDQSDERRAYFYFESGSSQLWMEPDRINAISPDEISEEILDYRKGLANHNNEALHDVLAFIQNHGTERLRLTVVGFATDLPVDKGSKSYDSNFELARARAEQVQHRVIERMNVPLEPTDEEDEHREDADGMETVVGGLRYGDNIEWFPFALSNEASPSLDPRMPSVVADPKLSVELAAIALPGHTSELAARTLQPQELALLDYLYFTIYTITTTGYGDIIPVSPFAKLVSAWANLMELFFLVVFFNVLIATVHQGVQSPMGQGENESQEERETR